MLSEITQRLDTCWATCLGCSVAQLRDGDRHVVATPRRTGNVRRPYPLRPDAISLLTCGNGWVLSVPSQLTEKAQALCLGLSFSDVVQESDPALEAWFARLETDEEAERPHAQVYAPLTRLAESLRVRGWSHYVHWYCDAPSWSDDPIDSHVRPISREDQKVWKQWLKWPGPFCHPRFESRFEISDAFGYILDDRLVSVAHLQTAADEFAWEFGVDTLRGFRSRGFATEVSRAATSSILEQGQIPWYYYDHYNHASSRIPQKLGYFLYAEGVFSHNR